MHADGRLGSVVQDARPAATARNDYRRASLAERTTVRIHWSDQVTNRLLGVPDEPYTAEESLAGGQISVERGTPATPLKVAMAVSFGAVGGACPVKDGFSG
jgi:hypothetical protein